MSNSFDTTTLILLLEKHFSMNLARIKFLSMIIWALVHSRTVNMVRISHFINSSATQDSIYKRLQRFIRGVIFSDEELAPFILAIMGIPDTMKLTLIFDRTNWKFGKKHINVLYLAVVFKGIAIPLFFSLLEDKKRGNSDHFDRLDLIERFIKVFGKERIESLLGDREFVGKQWIEGIQTEKIPYVMRAKEDGQYISNSQGEMVKAHTLFRNLQPGESLSLGRRRICKTDTYESFVSGIKTSKCEIIVLLHTQDIHKPWVEYRKRWEIEVLFKVLKSGGFNLEDTHVTDPDRLEVLFGIVAIACCVAYRIGNMLLEQSPVKLKKHGYKPKSIVRYGLDAIISCFVKCDIMATKILVDFFYSLGINIFPKHFNHLSESVL